MKASHNTFSYMRSTFFMELFSRFWRCQNIPATQQVDKYNVECCDIRVRYHKGYWRLCHGRAMFGIKYVYLSMLIYDCLACGFKKYRLMYETNDKGYDKFLDEFSELPLSLRKPCVAAMSNPRWELVYGQLNIINEHNKHITVRNLLWPSIKRFARKHNTYTDDGGIHMYDYVQFIKTEPNEMQRM